MCYARLCVNKINANSDGAGESGKEEKSLPGAGALNESELARP